MMKRAYRIAMVGSLLLLAGYGLGRWTAPAGVSDPDSGVEAATRIWTCSMHPQIRQDGPGSCPICGMELIPLDANPVPGSGSDAVLHMTETAERLAGVRTSRVAPADSARQDLVLNGRLRADASRMYTQTAHFPGRIERMDVEVEGERVRAGQAIAALYSPQLLTAQQELREAMRLEQPSLVRSARRKLALWKFDPEEIDRLADAENPVAEVDIRADAGGIVVERFVYEGDHVASGTPLYRLVDLGELWVDLDAYERDLDAIRPGDPVTVDVRAVPGRTFEGRVTYIDPFVDPVTRTAVVRTRLANPEGLLKPEMLVRGTVRGRPSAEGPPPLVVPSSAVLWTGERSIVYVRVPEEAQPAYALREVRLGTKLDAGYVVLGGLRAGEEVVTHGTFRVDAAAQLEGKPSMMQPDGGGMEHAGHGGGGALQPLPENGLDRQWAAYQAWVEALANDDPEGAHKAMVRWAEVLPDGKVATANLVAELAHAKDLEGHRSGLQRLSEAMLQALEETGLAEDTLYRLRCPMARDGRGGIWLSREPIVHNPYYGAAMPGCGAVEGRLPPR